MPDTILKKALQVKDQVGAPLFESAIESYRTEVLSGEAVVQENADDFFPAFEESLYSGRIKPDDIDYDRIMGLMPSVSRRYFDRGSKDEKHLYEEATDALVASQWEQLFDHCIQYTFRQFSCGIAPYTLGGLFSDMSQRCSDFTDERICEWVPEEPLNMCCWPKDDGLDPPANFSKVGQFRCWKTPKLCTRDFAFALHRSIVCVDPNGEARRQIDQHSRNWRDLIAERERVRQLFGISDCTEDGCHNAVNHDYHFDDVRYGSAYLDADASGPWVNSITDPGLAITPCNLAVLRCRIKEVFERMRDPHNCFPLDCPGDLQLTATNDCQVDNWNEMRSTSRLERALNGEACNTTGIQTPQLEGFSDGANMSRWIWDELVSYYLNCYSDTYNGTEVGPTNLTVDADLAQRTAELYAANTFLLSKNYPETFGMVMDFEEDRVHEGRDKWQYLERGIIWAKRHVFKYGYMWLHPWLTIRIRGFDPLLDADGGTRTQPT